MSRARPRALIAILTIIVGIAIVAAVSRRDNQPLAPRPEGDRPTLLLLTSLPLVLPEDFTLNGAGSPALTALRSRYKVVPISLADPKELARGGLLLMAQPQAQPAEDLVALDAWIRRGGRLLLLADPLLEWPSRRPLGDPLRPPVVYMDTGLLAHWGLRLDVSDDRGRADRRLGGYRVVTDSPGTIYGKCEISRDRFRAGCRLADGRAVIVTDADFLDAERLGGQADHNLDALLAELADLESR
jgi:hypothetical protein